jgi:hypothetical protein
VGLAELAGYRATLTISFEGTRAGAVAAWTKTVVMLAAREPRERQLSIEKQGDVADPSPVWLAEAGGVAYALGGDGGCTASVLSPDYSAAGALEPAGMLTGVLGAAEAGVEDVNGVAANHYTFDERALGQLGLAKATGEVWVAAEGGYVVRYVATTTGDADTFGDGLAGTLSMVYELTGITGQPAVIEAPASCPAGLVDAPRLPDAAELQNTPGLLVYATGASLADAAAFYLAELPARGWVLDGDLASAGSVAPEQRTVLLEFGRLGERLMVIASAGAAGAEVRLVLGRVSE